MPPANVKPASRAAKRTAALPSTTKFTPNGRPLSPATTGFTGARVE
jgi:hypothetical protein